MTVFSPQAVADWFGCGNPTDLSTTLLNAHGPHDGTGGVSGGDGNGTTIAFYGEGGSDEWLKQYSDEPSGSNAEPFVSPYNGTIDFLSFTHHRLLTPGDNRYDVELYVNGSLVYEWGGGVPTTQTAWIRPDPPIPVVAGDRISAFWYDRPDGPQHFFIHCHLTGELPSPGAFGSTIYVDCVECEQEALIFPAGAVTYLPHTIAWDNTVLPESWDGDENIQSHPPNYSDTPTVILDAVERKNAPVGPGGSASFDGRAWSLREIPIGNTDPALSPPGGQVMELVDSICGGGAGISWDPQSIGYAADGTVWSAWRYIYNPSTAFGCNLPGSPANEIVIFAGAAEQYRLDWATLPVALQSGRIDAGQAGEVWLTGGSTSPGSLWAWELTTNTQVDCSDPLLTFSLIPSPPLPAGDGGMMFGETDGAVIWFDTSGYVATETIGTARVRGAYDDGDYLQTARIVAEGGSNVYRKIQFNSTGYTIDPSADGSLCYTSFENAAPHPGDPHGKMVHRPGGVLWEGSSLTDPGGGNVRYQKIWRADFISSTCP